LVTHKYSNYSDSHSIFELDGKKLLQLPSIPCKAYSTADALLLPFSSADVKNGAVHRYGSCPPPHGDRRHSGQAGHRSPGPQEQKHSGANAIKRFLVIADAVAK
jgi:hypothetical protein